MGFQISALEIDRFSHLFGLDDNALAGYGVRRVIADSCPGYPCRVSLQDADVGESVFLLNYEHQPSESPYRSSHAIFVREWASQACPDKNEIPDFLSKRLLSVRAFDHRGMMLDAEVVTGQQLEPLIQRMLTDESVDYLHIHNAKAGCYAARVERS